MDFVWGWQEKDIIQYDQKCNPVTMVAKVIHIPQLKVCGQACTRLKLPGLMPLNLQASLLGSVKPPAPWLPQPGHLHPAGATLPHEDGGKAFLVDIYRVTSFSGALHGEGALFVLWHKSISSWSLQGDDGRQLLATKHFPPSPA